MKIAHVIIISTSILFIIFAVYGYITLETSQREQRNALELKNQAQAITIMQNLDKFIEERLLDATSISKTTDVQQIVSHSNSQASKQNVTSIIAKDEYEGFYTFIPPNTNAAYWQDFSDLADFYKTEYNLSLPNDISITNQFGAFVTVTGLTSNYVHDTEKWWLQAKNNGLYLGQLQKEKNSNSYFFPVAIKIVDNKGIFLGVMKLSLPLDGLLHNFQSDANIIKETGKNVILLDGNGKIIYTDQVMYDPVSTPISYYSRLSGDNGIVELENNTGESKLVAYFRSNGYGLYTGVDWMSIIAQDQSSVNAQFFNSNNSILIISAIGIAGSVLIGIFSSYIIARPIMRLSTMARRLSDGDLEARMSKSHLHEMRIIGDSFNNLADSLKKLIETEVKLAEANVKIKNERLSAIGELAASMAHNMKNPLTTIRSSADILKRNHKGDTTELADVISRMTRAIDRMAGQIDDVLNFVRVTPLHLENASLSSIIDSVIKTIDVPNNIKIELPKDGYKINCDVRKLEIVFTNLIINAIQAIGTRDKGRIIIRSGEENEMISVEVEDNGTGIPNELLPKLFEPLVTTKLQGTGLGLSTCKNIVEQHGGTINARNNPTILSFKIPKEPRSGN